MAKRIKTKLDPNISRPDIKIGGWIDGTRSYIWFGNDAGCLGTLTGYRLYRLAKAIAKSYEAEKAGE